MSFVGVGTATDYFFSESTRHHNVRIIPLPTYLPKHFHTDVTYVRTYVCFIHQGNIPFGEHAKLWNVVSE